MVGLSPRPDRPSHAAARAMQGFGCRIVLVRPAVAQVLDEQAYARLRDIPLPVDLVDVFHAAEHVPALVEEAVAIGGRTASCTRRPPNGRARPGSRW